jgi:DNA polymerase I
MNQVSPSANAGKERACLYLIDGSAYVYRAFHAVRGLSNSKGMPTNAVFGYTRMLIKLIQERVPRYVAVFFDAKGPTFRHEMYAEYKANRPSMPDELVMQLPYIKQVTAGFNIPSVELAGYEADDLIGTYARLAEAAGLDVVMVTGDKDFMQLVTDHVTIWDPMKDLIIDKPYIARSHDLAPGQLVDVMGLSGDTSDNIPGVPGIGPKTATTLIQQFGSMQALYDAIDTLSSAKQREKLLQYKEQAFLSRQLVTIDTRAPVPFAPEQLQAQPPDETQLTRLFQELEFRQLQHTFQQSRPQPATRYSAVLTEAALDELVGRLHRSGCFAIDTETTSQNPMAADLVGISVAWEPHAAFYIPCGHRYIGAPAQLSLDTIRERLQPLLADPAIGKVGQNIKYDWTVLQRHGFTLAGVRFDTMLGSYLLDPSKRAHNLDQIALDFLGHKTITFSDVAGKGRGALTFDQVTLEQAVPYACEDADITLRAYNVLRPQLETLGLMPLLEQVEMPLVPVLMGMEMAGVRLDRERLRELSKSFSHQLQQLEQEIYTLAGESFNIQSSQQLGRILFEKLQLPTSKKPRKRPGTPPMWRC